MSLQECEGMLQHNRLQQVYFKKGTEIASSHHSTLLDSAHSTNPSIQEVIGISVLTQSPSRNALKGCFLYRYKKWKQVYDSQMRQRTIKDNELWLSCDHTFRTIANVGLFRQEDGVWTKQYKGLFCILNSDGEVLSWKATKTLSFDSVCGQLSTLKERLAHQHKVVDEFIIDNCCSWRTKLQSIFGTDMKVSLDLFHAVQRISSKLSKRHSFHSHCLRDLSLVFRDPTDQGLIRTMVTPASNVLIDNLKKFKLKWKDVHYGGQQVITPNVVKELTAIQKHMERGCLSGIKVGRGTSRNERLHKQLNCVLKGNRYGPEMASALVTLTFFKHNEKILAKSQSRVPNPVEAYGCFKAIEESDNECFGLCSPSSIKVGVSSLPEPPCKCLLQDVRYNEATAIFDSIYSSLDEDEDVISVDGSFPDSGSSLSQYDAIALLQRAISNYYISETMQKQPNIKSRIQGGNVMFTSFLKTVHRSESLSTRDQTLQDTLSSWNFERVNVNGDGNCLFSSVAYTLIAHIQGGYIDGNLTLARIGSESMDPIAVARALRSSVVMEWLGDNCDHYQGFTTVDIQSHAQQYSINSEFAGIGRSYGHDNRKHYSDTISIIYKHSKHANTGNNSISEYC